jgi:hypothetical protein
MQKHAKSRKPCKHNRLWPIVDLRTGNFLIGGNRADRERTQRQILKGQQMKFWEKDSGNDAEWVSRTERGKKLWF